MQAKSKIVLFGGAFSPFHLGHFEICEQIVKQINPYKLWIIPYRKLNNQKQLMKSNHRLNLIRLHVEERPEIGVCEFELNLNQTSYTYITVEHFKSKYPGFEIYWVLGTDSLNSFLEWKNPNKILECCKLLHLKRKKNLLNPEIKEYFTKNYSNQLIHLECDITDVSSSVFNEQWAQFMSLNPKEGEIEKIKQFPQLKSLPPKVMKYLIQNQNHLY